ncbi:MAG: Amuc_1100 family pilus-like protein [Pseudomonadota bacterium]
MKLRQHMVLIVGGGIALVLMIVTLFMLFKFHAKYQRVNGDLKNTMQRLDTLYNRDPFPSDENVSLVQTNLDVLTSYFSELYASLHQGQFEPTKMEPAEFPLLLEKTIRKLFTRAMEVGVVLPQRFAFGFERYAIGALPNEGDVPRLVLQLKTIEELCGILYQSRVSEVVSITRQVFEQGAASQADTPMVTGRRFGAAMPAEMTAAAQAEEKVDPSGLFAREHYVLTFNAKDAAIWEVLNHFNRSKMFVIVTRVEFINDAPLPKPAPVEMAMQPEPGAGRQSLAPGQPPPVEVKPPVKPLEERMVAGRELVKAIVEVDVLRFLGQENKEAQP